MPALPRTLRAFYTLTQVYSAIPTIDATKVATGTSYLGVAGSAYPAKPLKTNQTLCYDPSGNSTSTISCAGSNQDGQYQKGVARSYADNGDGTITDNSTGLMWWKCTYGQSGSNCSGGSGNYVDFPTAIATCEADVTGGHSDWRLPNVMELESLVDFSTSSPAINSTYFPNTVSDYWWSATTYAIPDDQYVAWIVGFGDGGVSSDNKAATYLVRCVRG
jgi:hypothetical protein